MSADLQERTVTISGVKVVFPCKPYPSQFGMMDRVIKGIDRSQNCLLESPTGSGKSLALLCSSLAWQNAQHERITRENMAAGTADSGCCKPCTCGAETGKGEKELSPESKVNESKPEASGDPGNLSSPIVLSEDEDDDFKPSSKFRTPKQGPNVPKRGHVKIGYESDEAKVSPPPKCTCDTTGGIKKKQKVPKIYFGTRTHKQIAQIARELGKTAYHDVRMAILGSREYTCVHPDVVKSKNKSEGCKERLDVHGPGCTFYDKSKRVLLNQAQLQEDLATSWDLEDLVETCKEKKACPYFVLRNVKDDADIIFCPYNYLIDPLVRKSMEIELKDQIIVLDEAHNIEDCARDAASGSLTTDQITQAIHNLQEMLDLNVKFAAHLCLKKMLEHVLQFVEDNSNNLEQLDYDTSYRVWAGFDIVARLKNVQLGPDNYAKYKAAIELVAESDDDQQTTLRNQRNRQVKLSSSTLSLLEMLRQMFDYMYREELRFVEDYRVAIMKTMQFVPHNQTNGMWLGKNRRGGSRMQVHTLNFWCMNPAVAFSDFSACRNVVLSSGTLSPMSSFASELGMPFPIQLEANHVIQDKQVWVGAIGTGPGGTQLQAVYKNMETFTFQDELGNLVQQICMNVPHGVLCFFPSYRALDKFTERWKLTNVWSKIATRKRILMEPRRGDKEDFDNMMKAFYEVVKGYTCSEYLTDDHFELEDDDIDGAIFFAVCRGKVSEGMDFADNNARAVITVGIPYPSIKDLQVKLKRQYNDKHRVDRGLLSGGEWYEIQAFRALNQALGRCIRHRKDWGALIIVDDRFVRNTAKYTKGLSKWVRNKVQTYEVFEHFLSTLSTFNERMIKEMPTVSADTSFIPCTPESSQRRDSVYKRQSLDTSMNTSMTQQSQSPYFSPPMSLPKTVFQTPQRPKPSKQDTSSSHKQTPEQPKSATSSTQKGGNRNIIMTGGVKGLTEQQLLMDVINSSASPKDQPYYVILNKGLPNEQTFLVEPNKKGSSKGSTGQQGKASASPSQPVVPAPQIPSLPNLVGSQQLVASTGTPHNQLLLVQPPQMSGLPQTLTPGQISGLQLALAPGQQLLLPQQLMIPNSSVLMNSQVSESKGAAVVSRNTGAAVACGKSLLSGQMQTMNVGTKLPPSSVGAPDPQKPPVKDSLPPTNPAIQQTPVASSSHAVASTSHSLTSPTPAVDSSTPAVDSSTPAVDSSTNQNKFLQFCQLPKTPTHKQPPVAMVTPQCVQDSDQANASDTAAIDTKHDVTSDTPHIKQEQSLVDGNHKQDENDFKEDTKDESKKKKPLFRKTQTLGGNKSLGKPGLGTCDSEETTKQATAVVKREVTDDISETVTNSHGGKEANTVETESNNSHITVKCEPDNKPKSVADKLKQFRRVPSDEQPAELDRNEGVSSKKKLKSKGTGDAVAETTGVNQVLKDTVCDMTNAAGDGAGKEDSDDGEFLNTRRKSVRKRRSSCMHGYKLKRSKGVDYEEQENKVKENKQARKPTVSCVSCGATWLKQADFERRRRQPSFLETLSKKNAEWLWVPSLELKHKLVPLSSSVKGVNLDSMYDAVAGCCLQYLQCGGCNQNKAKVIGARVILAETGSEFIKGQTWIMAAAVNPL